VISDERNWDRHDQRGGTREKTSKSRTGTRLHRVDGMEVSTNRFVHQIMTVVVPSERNLCVLDFGDDFYVNCCYLTNDNVLCIFFNKIVSILRIVRKPLKNE